MYSPEGPNVWIDPSATSRRRSTARGPPRPYFHNGSVPTLWGVLKPADRPEVWKRPELRNGLGTNAGYDASFASYDWSKLGWNVTTLACGNNANSDPFIPCSQEYATADIVFANIANLVANYNSLAYQSPPPITQKQIRSRMISIRTSTDSATADMTSPSRSPTARLGLIEYLKTL